MTQEEKLRNHCQDRALEWFCASAMLVWAVILGFDGDTLTGKAFAAFSRHGVSEIGWAITFGVVGGARYIALYINGRYPKTPIVRMVGSLFGAVSWAQISWLFTEATYLHDGIMSTGTGIYALLAVAEIISIFRAAFDARYYSDARSNRT